MHSARRHPMIEFVPFTFFSFSRDSRMFRISAHVSGMANDDNIWCIEDFIERYFHEYEPADIKEIKGLTTSWLLPKIVLMTVMRYAYGVIWLMWWRHQMETFSALLAICAGNSPVSGEFPAQRPVTLRFNVFFDLCQNNPLRKQSWGWWFETPSHPLWRHRNDRCHSK